MFSRCLCSRLLTTLAFVAALVASHPVIGAGKPKPTPVYTATPIVMDDVFGMNNVGDVVGSGLYLSGQVYDLNTSFWDQLESATIREAVDINEPVEGARQIAGTLTWVEAGQRRYQAFRASVHPDSPVSAWVLTRLPAPEELEFGGFDSFAAAINNDGDVVGKVEKIENGTTIRYAVLWPAVGDALRLCVTNSAANDINDNGQVTGWLLTANGEQHAFRYTPGDSPELLDLGGLPKRPTSAGNGINSRGHVVGVAKGPYYYERVIRYTTNDVGLENLGTYFTERWSGSSAKAINSSGQIIGTSLEWREWLQAGFLYTDATGFVDISTLISQPAGLDPETIEPVAITDLGDSALNRILVNTNLGPYFLTPNSSR